MTIEALLQHWQIIVYLASLLIMGTLFYSQVNNTNQRQNECLDKLTTDLCDLKEREQEYRQYIPIAKSNVSRIEMLEKDSRRIDIAIAKIETKLVSIETTVYEIRQHQLENKKQ